MPNTTQTPHNTEQRQESRLETQTTVFIETEENTVVVSDSVDISANGLRVQIDQPLAVGSIHQVCIQLTKQPRLQLVTEVKWCREANQGGEYLLGLAIFESTGTDVQQWKTLIARYLITRD